MNERIITCGILDKLKARDARALFEKINKRRRCIDCKKKRKEFSEKDKKYKKDYYREL